MKKVKQPGDNISLKTKKTENPLVMSWLNSQSNLMDSIRYLVECEISSNGVRNLQACIPVERGELQEHSALGRPEPTAIGDSTASGGIEFQRGSTYSGESTGLRGSATLSESAASEEAAAARSQLAAATEAESADMAEEAEEEVDDEDIEAWS